MAVPGSPRRRRLRTRHVWELLAAAYAIWPMLPITDANEVSMTNHFSVLCLGRCTLVRQLLYLP